MKKLRIFDLLSSIQPIELKRFLKYIRSDSTNSGRDYIQLAEYLLHYYPDFSNSSLTMEAMYDTLYPGKKYNKRVIISRLSEFNHLTEDFLINTEIREDKFKRNKLLSEILLERKSYTSFDLLNRKMINENINFMKVSEKQLYELDQLMMLKGQSKVEREIYKGTPEFVKEHIEVFIIYFLSRLFNMYCGIKSLEDFQVPGDTLKTLKPYMEKIDFGNIVSLVKDNELSVYMNVMYLVYLLNQETVNDELYFRCKKEFINNIESLDTSAKFIIFNYLYTYCINQINRRRTEFDTEIYDILKNIIKQRSYALSEKEYMPSMLFREIVLTGIKMKDLQGVEKFINNYTGELAPEYKDTVHNYSTGKLKMAEKRYNQAIKAFEKCSNNMLIIATDIKMDKLVCYYELGWDDDIKENIEKNFHHLKVNKAMPEFQRYAFELFNTVFSKLFSAKQNISKETVLELKKEISEIKLLHYKKWFLKILEDQMK